MNQTITITAAMIDELAAIREQLRTLTRREEALKKAIRQDCDGQDTTYNGEHYALRIKFVRQERLDTVAAREMLGEEWCAAHTKTQVNMNIDAIEIL
jgi:hypothetical protein